MTKSPPQMISLNQYPTRKQKIIEPNIDKQVKQKKNSSKSNIIIFDLVDDDVATVLNYD